MTLQGHWSIAFASFFKVLYNRDTITLLALLTSSAITGDKEITAIKSTSIQDRSSRNSVRSSSMICPNSFTIDLEMPISTRIRCF